MEKEKEFPPNGDVTFKKLCDNEEVNCPNGGGQKISPRPGSSGHPVLLYEFHFTLQGL